MEQIGKQHAETKDWLKEMNPVGRIIMGVFLVILGLGLVLGGAQIHLPLLLLGIGAALAAAGTYGILTGIRDIPAEQQYRQVVQVSFPREELSRLLQVLDHFQAVIDSPHDDPTGAKVRQEIDAIRRAIQSPLSSTSSEMVLIRQSALDWSLWLLTFISACRASNEPPDEFRPIFQRIFGQLPAEPQKDITARLATIRFAAEPG